MCVASCPWRSTARRLTGVALLEAVIGNLVDEPLPHFEGCDFVPDGVEAAASSQLAEHLPHAVNRRLKRGIGVENAGKSHRRQVLLLDGRGLPPEHHVRDLRRGKFAGNPFELAAVERRFHESRIGPRPRCRPARVRWLHRDRATARASVRATITRSPSILRMPDAPVKSFQSTCPARGAHSRLGVKVERRLTLRGAEIVRPWPEKATLIVETKFVPNTTAKSGGAGVIGAMPERFLFGSVKRIGVAPRAMHKRQPASLGRKWRE